MNKFILTATIANLALFGFYVFEGVRTVNACDAGSEVCSSDNDGPVEGEGEIDEEETDGSCSETEVSFSAVNGNENDRYWHEPVHSVIMPATYLRINGIACID